MAFFGNLRCHYCGSRSSYKRGTLEFRCSFCQANNFFDKSGNVVDTPSNLISANAPDESNTVTYSTLNKGRGSVPPQTNQSFCDTCIKNQQLYTERISNYLPDETHPQYKEYEANLPEYKKDLERRYPLVCQRCAPLAQTTIHNADLNSQTMTLAVSMRKTRGLKSRGRHSSRRWDTLPRRSLRGLLTSLDLIVSLSVLIQAAWHAYGAASIGDHVSMAPGMDGSSVSQEEPTFGMCLARGVFFHCTPDCLQLSADVVLASIYVSLLLIWFNPAWKYHFDSTHVIDATCGKTQYYAMQIAMLVTRAAAYIMTTPVTTTPYFYSAPRVKAFHASMAVFLLLAHWLSRTGVGFRKRKVNSRIMPMPTEQDVLGRDAGPAESRPTPQASSMNPFRLFQRGDRPFPIQDLAGKSRGQQHAKSQQFGHPSPPTSQSPSSDEDAMDFDWDQPTAAPSHSAQSTQAPGTGFYWNSGAQGPGWSAMREETYRMETTMREEDERRRREAEATQLQQQHSHNGTFPNTTSLFHGSLPPAPMSMERRLRNPPRQTPVGNSAPPAPSQQPNFIQNMREGFQQANTFRPQLKRRRLDSTRNPKPDLDGSQYDSDEAVQGGFPRPGSARQFEIRPGQWTLQKDLDAQATGLEDLFGGQTFSIDDEQQPGKPGKKVKRSKKNGASKASGIAALSRNSPAKSLTVAAVVAVLAFAAAMLFSFSARRAVALRLLGLLIKLETWLFIDPAALQQPIVRDPRSLISDSPML